MDADPRSVGFPPREAVEEDDGGVELSLGLSIGSRSFRNARRACAGPRRAQSDMVSSEVEADRRGTGASMSSSPPPPLPPFQQGEGGDGLDPLRRREMHALRRQEARKKRHEKQQKKGLYRVRNGGISAAAPGPGFRDFPPPLERARSRDDRVPLQAQEQRARVRHREAREEELRHCERRAGQHPEHLSDSTPNPELHPVAAANHRTDGNPNPSFSPGLSNTNLPPLGALPFSVLAKRYPYPQMQYVPVPNGFGSFPCMMPCWAPVMSFVGGRPNPTRNVFQPGACQAFRPFSSPVVDLTNGASPLSTKVVDSGVGGEGAGIKQAPSWTGSLGSNSSWAISDNQSNSLQGGSSGGEIRSHSGDYPEEVSPPQHSPQASNLVQGQSDQSVSWRCVEQAEVSAVADDPSEKTAAATSTQPSPERDSNTSKCAPAGTEERTVSVNNRPASAAADDSITPPRPPPPPVCSPLPRMPCVSATGNGPNGKTITGFLYRFSNAELSIVCVCHGSSFSPAEFVKHAGGTDVANPLRHIMVIPS